MNTLTINADQGTHEVNRHIYGHFAEHLGRCIYEGFWVGEDSPIPNVRGIRSDVVAALRRLDIPNLRWPGGCFADEYHWKDGIGPREKRPAMINTHWGGVSESNHFGTHEFFDLCEMLGAEPYICGNVGSGTVQEMSEWVEYCVHVGPSPMADLRAQNGHKEAWKLPFFGVGNESWGCGGNMRPEYYADEYRRYQTYVRQYAGDKTFKIACGANATDYEWTEVLMSRAGAFMDGLSLHFYTVPGTWNSKGSATQFSQEEYFATLQNCLSMEELLRRHEAIMDKHDPDKRVALIVDEWGTWFDVEPGTNPGFLYQQNTGRDALVAGLTFHIFHRYADRVRMANIAQTINVLQAMILTDGARILLTPTFHVFEMFRVHQGGTFLPVVGQSDPLSSGDASIPAVSASATRDSRGQMHLSLCHTDPNGSASVEVELRGANFGHISGQVLESGAMGTHNSFDNPDTIVPRALSKDELRLENGRLRVQMPPASVAVLSLGGAR